MICVPVFTTLILNISLSIWIKSPFKNPEVLVNWGVVDVVVIPADIVVLIPAVMLDRLPAIFSVASEASSPYAPRAYL